MGEMRNDVWVKRKDLNPDGGGKESSTGEPESQKPKRGPEKRSGKGEQHASNVWTKFELVAVGCGHGGRFTLLANI